MAIEAKLKLNGKGYNLIDCEYEFFQPIDQNYKPSGNPKGGIIKFTISSEDENDLTFHKWMLNKTEVKSGTILFSVSNVTDKKEKILLFEHAYCIGLNEYFSKETNKTPTIPSFSKIPGSTIEVAETAINIGKSVWDFLSGTFGSVSSPMLTRVMISAAIISFDKAKNVLFTNNELLV